MVGIVNFELFIAFFCLIVKNIYDLTIDFTYCRLNSVLKVTAVQYNPHATLYGVALMVLNFNI